MDTTKIIKGVVNSGRYTVTAPIVKEDYGLYLQIEGVELPSTYEVDFSNSEHNGTSVTMIGNSDGVLIPHQFIDTGKDVFAFLYHVGADYGRTVYKFRIPNKVRPDRTNEEPTPEEQSVIDQAISALNTAVEQTSQDVIDADESANSAKDDADRAERARTGAETAQGKAEEAQESAERAKDDAETSERNASESERKAKGYADTASEKADAITGLTATAQTLPYGSSATANYNPETGVMSFGIPKGKDGTNGIDGNDGYSPTASVTKSGKVATITITDKNGTTNAQVSDGEDGATGATPNLTIGTVETLEPDESATATITGTPENPVLNLGIPQGDTGEVTTEEFLKAFVTDSASGSIASFPDGADDLPLKSLVVDIDPIQDLHGYDSPWVGGSGKNLITSTEYRGSVYNNDVGGNLKLLSPRITYTQSGNVITITNSGSFFEGQVFATAMLPSGQYAVHYESDSADFMATIYIASEDFIVEQKILNTGGVATVSRVVTLDADARIVVGLCNVKAGSIQATNLQVESGSVYTSWTPYENLCPITGWEGCEVNATGYNVWDEQWESGGYAYGNPISDSSRIRNKNYIPVVPNTTYFFKKGLNNGNMWVFFYDRNKVCLNRTVNGNNVGNTSGIVTTPDKCYYVNFFLSAQTEYQHDVTINYPSTDHDYHPYVGQTIPINWQSETGTVYGGKLDVLTGKLTVYPYYASYNGETLTGEWISDRDVYAVGTTPTIGAQVVNIGAQGTEYQLEPHEVASLLGTNNIFADTGDTEVEYRADTKLYIERLTEPDADMIADANIVSGQYFMVGNSLFKATANIASGAQVIVGTNATRKSLAQALNEINA